MARFRTLFKPRLPSVVPDTESCRPGKSTTSNTTIKRILTKINGVEFTLRAYAFCVFAVVLINISWSIWAKTRYETVHHNGSNLGFGQIFLGDCSHATKLDSYLHLLINFLATLLVCGSNVFLAVYSAPSREELNEAHKKKHTLSIGIFSLRNYFFISKRKAIICSLLALTSIPFTLMWVYIQLRHSPAALTNNRKLISYNSLIFTSTAATEYRWATVTESFLQNAPLRFDHETERVAYEKIQQELWNYEQLDKDSCIDAYSDQFLSTRRNVVIVATGRPLCCPSVEAHHLFNITETCVSFLRDHESIYDPAIAVVQYGYVSLPPSPLRQEAWNASNYSNATACWSRMLPRGMKSIPYNISGCFSERVETRCSVRFSWDIMVTVLACASVKLLLIIFIIKDAVPSKLLMTVGDAMSSFLRDPDPFTAHLCRTTSLSKAPWKEHKLLCPFTCQKYSRGRYWLACHGAVWMLYLVMMSTGLVAAAFLLKTSIQKLASDHISVASVGFGNISQFALAFGNGAGPASSITTATIVANAPQLVLSVIYFVYQNIMMSMFLMRDWNNFGSKDLSLMVSSPAGEQRGAWQFAIPLLPGIALQAFQFIMHWMVSQAIFPVLIIIFNADGERLPSVIHNCGFSPLAILASLICGSTLLLTAVFMGAFKVTPEGEGGPPLVSTCSAAISAACHYHPAEKEDMEVVVRENLRWGVLGELDERGVGHCTFAPATLWHEGKLRKPFS